MEVKKCKINGKVYETRPDEGNGCVGCVFDTEQEGCAETPHCDGVIWVDEE